MRRSWIRIWLLAAVLSAALTGCIPRSRGGASTQRGLEAMEQGQYEEAAADFEKAVDQGEDPVPAWRGLGISYIALARYDEAAEALETALSFTDSKMPETIREPGHQFRQPPVGGVNTQEPESLFDPGSRAYPSVNLVHPRRYWSTSRAMAL